MTDRDRRSIRSSASVRGVGLHTGRDVSLTFRPAVAGSGILFRRVDMPQQPEIPAHVRFVCTTERRTVLGAGDATIETVEHVLAAVAGLEVDDLYIEVDGPEVPILDGSAKPFFSALESAGVVVVEGDVPALSVSTTLTVQDGDAEYVAKPGPRSVTVSIEWDHPLIGAQMASFIMSPGVFATELAGARTFGFAREIEALRARGLIKGGHLGCAVVLSETGVVNGELRWADEFVRHKALDLLGDLALAGGRLDCTVVASRPSHRGNVAFARALYDHCSSGK
ncbi:MAG: UDP-3-O-[3-hydroxymyristoyl] N-acetylglucosamine deacetylase [Gemmatimonadetes bacterium]|nr:UDP-3-O-[3-hydroxymyristoyl] N-acetylglucosamine deacetylase [Gemmatimonadota bacterium]